MAMLFNNGSLSIWGFEFEIGVLDYLMNIDEKFIFVKKFDVIDVFELIEKDLGSVSSKKKVAEFLFYFIF